MKVIINTTSLNNNELQNELMLLTDVVAQSQATNEVVSWEFDEQISHYGLFSSLLRLYKNSCSFTIECSSLEDSINLIEFRLNASNINDEVKTIETEITNNELFPKALKIPLSYILDEFVCNMQQHSQSTEGYIYASINRKYRTLDILVADKGITIYGSYVNAGKYLEYLGECPAEALSLAKDGYSTKNRPDAENRGYGISSNAKMIVEGLHGSFSIISGSAIYLYTPNIGQQIFSFTDFFEWCGTSVIARIPLDIPSDFSFYDYIS